MTWRELRQELIVAAMIGIGSVAGMTTSTKALRSSVFGCGFLSSDDVHFRFPFQGVIAYYVTEKWGLTGIKSLRFF